MGRRKRTSKLRSGIEDKVQKLLKDGELPHEYEQGTLPYLIPESPRNYHWDFRFPNGVIVEVKGKMDNETKRKMLLVKEQNPDEDIRFLFYTNNLLQRGGKRRYSDWCRWKGFPCCFMKPGNTIEQTKDWKEILLEWYKE